MSDDEKPGRQPTEAELRKARLAQQLRDNLKRRKAQMRARRHDAGTKQPAKDENG
ncbi:hypothetical protein GCM10007276_05970 [Agaricicola taiwanensis]|uniref:Uncharacterized protein n=1 Tax=Agaricicola taiwanensis TaxID=591372 RepID=A0A8J2YG04_9RHOB|nr:hypothetical protein [Agaricicola taiwanensis]GGE31604.1 hypothetical protein GCM10007276_05970 [Agaricicola taiwanensis]